MGWQGKPLSPGLSRVQVLVVGEAYGVESMGGGSDGGELKHVLRVM